MASIMVDPDDVVSGQRQRDGQPAAADTEFEQRIARLVGETQVDLGVVRHIKHVQVVEARQRPLARRQREGGPPARCPDSAFWR